MERELKVQALDSDAKRVTPRSVSPKAVEIRHRDSHLRTRMMTIKLTNVALATAPTSFAVTDVKKSRERLVDVKKILQIGRFTLQLRVRHPVDPQP